MYQETYVEQIIKRTVNKQEITLKNIFLVLMIFFGFMTFFAVKLYFLILFIIFAVLYYTKNKQINTEYEYLYLEGTLEIDRVCFQSKRKKMVALDMSEVQVVAPEGSQKALAYDHGQMSVMRFGSGDADAQVFIMMARIKDKNKQVKIFWEPNRKLLEAMKNNISDRIFTE